MTVRPHEAAEAAPAPVRNYARSSDSLQRGRLLSCVGTSQKVAFFFLPLHGRYWRDSMRSLGHVQRAALPLSLQARDSDERAAFVQS